MKPSFTAKLLDELQRGDVTRDRRPWGVMLTVNSPEHDLTIKYITVHAGARTSLQYHERKDELIVLIAGQGHVTLDDRIVSVGDVRCVRVAPGVRHRVVGPLEYIEVSTYDKGDDTVRVLDDYGRAP